MWQLTQLVHELDFKFLCAVSRDCFFKANNNTWKYTGFESLKGVKVGVAQGYSYGQIMDDFKNKKENKKLFDEIVKIPQKARLARNAENVKFQPVAKCSVTYLKSEGHPGVFYKIDENEIVHELNFVEAAKIFRASEKEEAIKPLPEFHHDQVNKATLVAYLTQ